MITRETIDPLRDLTATDLSAMAAHARKRLRGLAARKLRSDFVPEPGHKDAAIFQIARVAARCVAVQEAAFRAWGERERKENIGKQR